MKTIYNKTTIAVAAATAFSTLQIPTAYAQKKVGLEEVVVTAQRREQSLLDVPIAISALTSNDLRNQGITQTSQLSASVPNLNINSAFGDAQPNFSLRGISVGNEYNTNQASPVGVYIDDEYLPFRSTHGMQLFDLERIEVLRGPQGTLFGRNTTGGAVNFITKKPTLNGSSGYLDIGVGNFNQQSAQLAVEITPTADTFGIRAAINYKESDGFVSNVSPGVDDGNSSDSLSGRLSMRLVPSDDLDIGLTINAADGNPTQAAVWHRGTNADNSNPLTGYNRSSLDFWEVDSFRMDNNQTDQVGALLTLEYTINDRLSLFSLTSYGEASLTFGQEGTGTPFQLLDTRYNSDFEWFNQELRLTYQADSFNLQSGIYYGSDDNETDNFYGFFYFAGPTVAQSVIQHFVQTRDSTALFVQSDIDLSERITLTLGGRYTWDEATYEEGSAYVGDINRNVLAYTVGTATAPMPDRSSDDGAASWRVALNYNTAAGHTLYGSYSHGYRAGTFSGQGYFSEDQIYITDPEEVDAYEIGIKGRFFDGQVEASAAYFYSEYTDQQINEVVGAVGFLRNAGESTLQGLEFESKISVNENLLVRLSGGWLDASYDKLELSNTSLDGNQLPSSPEITANAGVDWIMGSALEGTITFSPNITYTSEQWFSPFNDKNNNQFLRQGDLTLLTANLSWTRGPLEVRVWGTNLTDEEHFSYGLNLQDAFGYDYLLQGAPRMYGLGLRYDFE